MSVKGKDRKDGNTGGCWVTAPQRLEQYVCDFCRGAGHSMKTCELFLYILYIRMSCKFCKRAGHTMDTFLFRQKVMDFSRQSASSEKGQQFSSEVQDGVQGVSIGVSASTVVGLDTLRRMS